MREHKQRRAYLHSFMLDGLADGCDENGMGLEPPDQQHWQAAVGYAELGMFTDADSELDKIDPFLRAAPEILALRVEIYQGLEKWELMAELTSRLTEFESDNPQWPVSLAYATRRANSIEAAKEILMNAES